MKKMTRPAAMFVADALAIDFLNSVAIPSGKPVEWLADGEDLLAWLEQAHLLPRDMALWMRSNGSPEELDDAAAQARALREWFRGFIKRHKGRALAADALEELAPLNVLLEQDEVWRPVGVREAAAGTAPGGAGMEDAEKPVSAFVRVSTRRWRSPASLLFLVADAMAELVCSADLAQVKSCEGAACSLMFLDTTQGHARRWCSMAVCGNRAKQAAYRERVRQRAT